MTERLVWRISERARGFTFADLAAEALARARRRGARGFRRAIDRFANTHVTDHDLARSLSGKQLSKVAVVIRERLSPHFTAGLADLEGTTQSIKRLFPGSVAVTLVEAESILDHRIRVFDRLFDLGSGIDWHRDPGTGASWPIEHFTQVPLVHSSSNPSDAGANQPQRGPDVRVVWELNRLHHFTTLGRAYALTGQERFTEEFLLQLTSWNEQNPPRIGINWAVAMEVAIRAVNLIAALDLFRDSPLLDSDAIGLVLKMLIAHGRFIKANLEFRHGGSSNHYLSDLIGLFVIGMTMPDLKESAGWVSYSASRLVEELDQQVLADGADYEGATGYHRLVLEIFATFFALSRLNGFKIPEHCSERLEAMFDFVRHYLKPDGTAPLLGDSDDGRLIRFKERPAVDHSYLLSIAAVLLDSSTFKTSNEIDEEAVWWFGRDGLEQFQRLAVSEVQPGSRAFTEAQIFIQRATIEKTGTGDDASGAQNSASLAGWLPANSEQLYAIVDCGDNGAHGHGSHAHCDQLSLEVFAYDRTFLRDTGTFAYTGSERWRNVFRSTAYHNTVRVDGEEISTLVEGWLFALGSNVRPVVNRWESTSERDLLDAEHHGYSRLVEPVVHRRIITFEKREGYWTIEDRFSGKGLHTFEFFFILDCGLEVVMTEDQQAVARAETSMMTLVPISEHKLEATIEPRWVSLAYGTCTATSVIIYRLRATVPFNITTLLIPCRKNDEARVERIIRTSRQGVTVS